MLFWDVSSVANLSGGLTERQAEDLWDALADERPAKAYAAVWQLRQHAEEALCLLRKHLPPGKQPPEKEIRTLIGQLDSDQFDEREAAMKQLKKMVRVAEDALRRTLKSDPPPEQKRRIQELLVFPEPTGVPPKAEVDRRAVRAVAILEANPAAPARQLLEDWAKGTPGEWLTEEAARALARRKGTNPRDNK